MTCCAHVFLACLSGLCDGVTVASVVCVVLEHVRGVGHGCPAVRVTERSARL